MDWAAALHKMMPRICSLCSRPLDTRSASHGLCDTCVSDLDMLLPGDLIVQQSGITRLGFYGGKLSALMISYKKGRNPAGHRIIAGIFYQSFSSLMERIVRRHGAPVIILTWPPGSPMPRFLRGYDHMRRICRTLAALLRRDGFSGVRTRPLFRRGSPVQQKSLDRPQRVKNAELAVRLRKRCARQIRDSGAAAKPVVVIIDDVSTTGATLKRSAELLENPAYAAVYQVCLLQD
jgi:predicted amidophosphoribosyltransferase